MAYRSSVQESTSETPHAMLYGMEMELPIYISSTPVEPETDKVFKTDYAQAMRNNLRAVHDRARENVQQAAKRQKRNYDRGIITQPIQVESFVWLHQEVRKKGRRPKLQFKWDGPYLVTTKLSDVVYRIQKSPQSKPKVEDSNHTKANN
ncbi:uncharacterized protein [Amphiura filiformis]|uniref:uncharacterized protein n=1 Tax=Amphiura filiformis TaxID=82378 RepID=UPI003B215FC3